MALQARHKWIAENVAVAFGRESAVSSVEDVIREHTNLKKVNDFLEGKSKQQHLFFYYQKPDVINDAGEYVDGPGEAKILVTTGEQERLKSRACFFLRTWPPNCRSRSTSGATTTSSSARWPRPRWRA